jgi:hypothetical protein
MSAASTDLGSESFIDLGARLETMHLRIQSRARPKAKKIREPILRIVPAYDELSLRPQSTVKSATAALMMQHTLRQRQQHAPCQCTLTA